MVTPGNGPQQLQTFSFLIRSSLESGLRSAPLGAFEIAEPRTSTSRRSSPFRNRDVSQASIASTRCSRVSSKEALTGVRSGESAASARISSRRSSRSITASRSPRRSNPKNHIRVRDDPFTKQIITPSSLGSPWRVPPPSVFDRAPDNGK